MILFPDEVKAMKVRPTKRRVALPPAGEMFRRLTGVNPNEDPPFYEILLENAGKGVNYGEIIHIMAAAARESAGDDREKMEETWDAVPRYIMALVDDQDVAVTAKVLFKRMTRAIKKKRERGRDQDILPDLPDAELLD